MPALKSPTKLFSFMAATAISKTTPWSGSCEIFVCTRFWKAQRDHAGDHGPGDATSVTGSTIIARLQNGVGRLTLNRPQAIHALTTDMCHSLVQHLQQWVDNPHVRMVMIDHEGERGFCAGGDIRMLAQSGQRDGVEARAFFFIEYQLNALLMAYPKPFWLSWTGSSWAAGWA